MKTAGVDMSSQDSKSAASVISWANGGATLDSLQLGVADADIVRIIGEVDKIGIDVPLGWPTAFVEAVAQHGRDGTWPKDYRHANTEAFRYRRTDLHTWRAIGGAPPLSVSTDRIGIPSMRAAAVLAMLPERMPLDGSGVLVEVYPAAALRIWGFASRQYKGTKHRAGREQLVRHFVEMTERWLTVGDEHRQLCRTSDDAFDAVIAALVARATAIRRVRPIPPEDADAARREGWIALPADGTLATLANG